MASFSSDLLAVLDGLASLSSQTLTSTYRKSILDNAEALNKIVQPGDGASPMENVSAATTACKLVFGERAVLPEMPSYEQEQRKNWSV
jgi:hypothetical protein